MELKLKINFGNLIQTGNLSLKVENKSCKMNIEKMSKPELVDQYKKIFGEVPAGLSKAELIEAIESAIKEEAKELKESDEPGIPVFPDNKTETDTTDSNFVTVTENILKDNPDLVGIVRVGEVIGVPVAEIAENDIELVKCDDLGNVIDRQTLSKEAWNLLPNHKYGWKKAAPKEIQ
jgi:hypothetical protein